jgi:hypothetical protein
MTDMTPIAMAWPTGHACLSPLAASLFTDYVVTDRVVTTSLPSLSSVAPSSSRQNRAGALKMGSFHRRLSCMTSPTNSYCPRC